MIEIVWDSSEKVHEYFLEMQDDTKLHMERVVLS